MMGNTGRFLLQGINGLWGWEIFLRLLYYIGYLTLSNLPWTRNPWLFSAKNAIYGGRLAMYHRIQSVACYDRLREEKRLQCGKEDWALNWRFKYLLMTDWDDKNFPFRTRWQWIVFSCLQKPIKSAKSKIPGILLPWRDTRHHISNICALAHDAL